MNKVVNKISIIAAAIAIGLVTTASTSFACRGNCVTHGTDTSAAITAEQQQKLDAVKEKYAPELAALQASLNEKADEYSKALTDESTTVGTLNRLEADRVDLERQYFALLDQANNEAGVHLSGNNGPWFGCNYSGCHHRNHMETHSYGRHMGPNHKRGMHGNRMARCW